MADSEPVGISSTPPDGQELIGAYESPTGIEVFQSETPYLSSDGKTLLAPIPVFDAGGPTYTNSAGELQDSLPLNGLSGVI